MDGMTWLFGVFVCMVLGTIVSKLLNARKGKPGQRNVNLGQGSGPLEKLDSVAKGYVSNTGEKKYRFVQDYWVVWIFIILWTIYFVKKNM